MFGSPQGILLDSLERLFFCPEGRPMDVKGKEKEDEESYHD